MTQHLVFTLAAAMGATGEFAGHERRGSVGWPGRSAILGLVGAALGIRRDQKERFAVLDPLSMAVAVFREGDPLRDYHTVMTIPTAKAKRPSSRKAAFEQAGSEINTTITIRDYRCNPVFAVALWGVDLAPLMEALKSPTFTVYLGRKSCPLSTPMHPLLVEAETPLEALAKAALPPWLGQMQSSRIYSDLFEGVPDGLAMAIEQRHDNPIDRQRWHFAPRAVHRFLASINANPVEVP